MKSCADLNDGAALAQAIYTTLGSLASISASTVLTIGEKEPVH